MRYLIDENTTHALGDQLRRRQPDIAVLTVGDDLAPPLGTLDPDILLWLESKGYCLITRNRHSMPQHLQDHLATGHHVPGIFTLRPSASMGQVIDDLLLIWGASHPNEYQDQIVHIPF
jgi:hypothetical protein